MTQLVIRTTSQPGMLLPLVRLSVESYDRSVVVASTSTMEELAAASIAEERFRGTLSGLFAAIAVALAAIGLYGLASRLVADRQREIGLRVALGAVPRDVRRLVIREVAVVLGLGALAGLPAAYAASRVAQSLLFGVTPSAWPVYVIATGLLAATAGVAALIPARRASRIDPVVALRE